jgi:hypothetical protein
MKQLLLAATLIALSACSSSREPQPFYASPTNPHPELPGFEQIPQGDGALRANLFDPRPDLAHPSVPRTAGTPPSQQ